MFSTDVMGTGVVVVSEGRREFRELERAARRAGYTKKRAPEYVPLPARRDVPGSNRSNARKREKRK